MILVMCIKECDFRHICHHAEPHKHECCCESKFCDAHCLVVVYAPYIPLSIHYLKEDE